MKPGTAWQAFGKAWLPSVPENLLELLPRRTALVV
jgi:hypothetical protein